MIVLMILGFYMIQDTFTLAEVCTSNHGKEFYVGIPSNARGYRYSLSLDITSTVSAKLYIEIPFYGINETKICPKGVTVIPINKTLQQDGTFVENRGIHIKANVSVAVYVTSNCIIGYCGSGDTYMALPLSCLGTSYVVSSYTPYHGEMSEFVVVGVHDLTHVVATFPNGTRIETTLNRLDVYQETIPVDLTNTVIKSDKQVALIAGATCTMIDSIACDMIMSQMIPSNLLGSTYLIPPVYLSTTSRMRIVNVNETEIDICIDNRSCPTIAPHRFREERNWNQTVVVVSKSPVLIAEYNGYDPYMMMVPSIEQYMNDYSFAIPQAFANLSNYIAVIIPQNTTSGLRIDDKLLRDPVQTYPVPHIFSNFTVRIYQISHGYHHVRHTEGVAFAVICFGTDARNNTHYGFPAGLFFGHVLVNRIDCGHVLDISHGHVQYSSGTTYRSIATYTCDDGYSISGVSSRQCAAGGNWTEDPPFCQVNAQPQCFVCDDSSHASLCDTVERCQDNQICYVERYLRHGHVAVFKSGCIDSVACERRHNATLMTNHECFECCNNDFCNNKGCLDPGLPPRDKRGPVCFDCQHVASPEECHFIQPCHMHQVCGIEQIEWGDYSHYEMGCASEMCGPLHSEDEPLALRAPRSTPVCKSCCTEDYCNLNCTGHPGTGSIIIG